MASLQSNILKGAIRVSDDLVIGGSAETCNISGCGAYMSSDGCSNPACVQFRGEPILQTVIRKSPTLGERIRQGFHSLTTGDPGNAY